MGGARDEGSAGQDGGPDSIEAPRWGEMAPLPPKFTTAAEFSCTI